RRPAALPRRRDFVERARRAVLGFPALLLPAFLAADRRAGLDFFPDAAGFPRRRAGRCRFAFERAGRGKPIAFLVVSAIGSPVAADFPAMAPITPPTTAPTGPPTLPRTAPAAAPAAGLEIGGTVMFSLDFDCALEVEFSAVSSAIYSPGFNAESYHRRVTAA